MIPIYREITEVVSNNYNNGNPGLLFNKFIDLNPNGYSPLENYLDNYTEKYNRIKNNADNLLEKKHFHQYCFCKTFEKLYDILIVSAELLTPMIIGIGQSHPGEVGMIFDHTIGIPYIPASSVKGIVRFSHILNMIEDPKNEDKILDRDEIDDEEDWTFVKHLFGTGGDKGNVGNVIFLDAYPIKSPNLHVDIINPHYQKYYTDERNTTPPSDNLEPVPIKFLTVKNKNEFIFRVLIKKNIILEDGKTLFDLIKKALERVLTIEGIGAKTAIGYGRFKINSYLELENIITKYEETSISENERLFRYKNSFIERIKKAPKESNDINLLFDEWQKDESLKNDKDIASSFKEKIRIKKADKTFTKQYQIVSELLKLDNEAESTSLDQKSTYTNNQSEDEYEKVKKKILNAKGDMKKINKILKEYKRFRKRLEEELGLK